LHATSRQNSRFSNKRLFASNLPAYPSCLQTTALCMLPWCGVPQTCARSCCHGSWTQLQVRFTCLGNAFCHQGSGLQLLQLPITVKRMHGMHCADSLRLLPS
jgi:hypothetical protein